MSKDSKYDKEIKLANLVTKREGGKARRAYLCALADSIVGATLEATSDDLEESMYVVSYALTQIMSKKFFPEDEEDEEDDTDADKISHNLLNNIIKIIEDADDEEISFENGKVVVKAGHISLKDLLSEEVKDSGCKRKGKCDKD